MFKDLKAIVANEVNVVCNSNVLSVLAEHLSIQLATRYGEKMCSIKYHVSGDRSSIVELAGGVGTQRSVSAYHEPAWHFDAKFVSGKGHEMANTVVNTFMNSVVVMSRIIKYVYILQRK